MINLYLDKNVLSHILTGQRTGKETNQVTADDIKKLRQAVSSGRIRYALNASSEKVAEEELKLIQELLYQEAMIKFPKELLLENISNYARKDGPADPLTLNLIDLDALFSPKDDIEERKQALADTKKQETEFLEVTTRANDNDRADARSNPIVAITKGRNAPRPRT